MAAEKGVQGSTKKSKLRAMNKNYKQRINKPKVLTSKEKK